MAIRMMYTTCTVVATGEADPKQEGVGVSNG